MAFAPCWRLELVQQKNSVKYYSIGAGEDHRGGRRRSVDTLGNDQ
jgi:hypothetical protein